MNDDPKGRILVAQNFFACRNVIVYILKQSGFKQVRAVRDGSEALSELSGGAYAIALSDWQMAGMDGISLLRTIREDPELRELIFIIVAAESDRDKVMEAKDCGVDGYLTKPFTAESLCKKIFEALKARCKGQSKELRKKPVKPASLHNRKPSDRIFLEVAGGGMYHARRKHQAVVKGEFAAMMQIMSLQLNMMKAESGFVPVKEMINKVKSGINKAERQAEHATLIAKTTSEINQAFEAVDSVPDGSPESMDRLNVIDQSAAKLADMIDSFDKEVAEVVGMLNSVEHMVHKSHVNEIDKSIKASCALEVNDEDEFGVSMQEESTEFSGKVVEGLARIRSVSETARESLTTVAGGITNVIERSGRLQCLAAHHSHELFQQLSVRIDHILDMLDSQITLAEKLGTGMGEVAAVQKKIIEPDELIATGPAVTAVFPPEVAGPQHAGDPTHMDGTATLKKIWEHRILMIDIVKKEHGFSIKDLEGMLRDNAEFFPGHLPGDPASSFSKWVDHSLTQKDYYDVPLCRQIARYRDEMHVHALKAVQLLRSGSKDEALENYQKVNALSNLIGELLGELQDNLRKKV